MPKKKFDNNQTEQSDSNSDKPLANKRFDDDDDDDFDAPLDDEFGEFDDLNSLDDDDDY